jgi:hypothetical protein
VLVTLPEQVTVASITAIKYGHQSPKGSPQSGEDKICCGNRCEETPFVAPFSFSYEIGVIACQDRLGTQARGELKNLGCFFCRDFATHPCAPASCPISSGKKTRLFAPLIPKMIILPGQARDKHRRSTQKQTVFSQARKASTISRRCRSMRRSSMASASASRRKCAMNRQADRQTNRQVPKRWLQRSCTTKVHDNVQLYTHMQLLSPNARPGSSSGRTQIKPTNPT